LPRPTDKKLPFRGTLLNTLTVAVGSIIGLLAGSAIPDTYKAVAISGLGLVTVGLAIRMFLQVKDLLVVAATVAIGGLIGKALGIDIGVDSLAEFLKGHFAGGKTFNEGLITASILFCVGPMTLLGCIEDGLEGKIELLSIKSLMDGIASVFFAAALGHGVLVSALIVLVFQGLLTLGASYLKPIASDEALMADLSGAGGAILLGTGFGLLGVLHLRTEIYLPALVLAPCLVWVTRRFQKRVDAR